MKFKELVAIGALLAACGGAGDDGGAEAGPDAGGGPEPVAANVVEGTVEYAGAQDGALVVGVFTEVPPMSGPVAFHSVPQPSFPETFELLDVEAGEYFVVVTLDVGRDNPTSPGPEDLQASSEPIVVTDTEGARVELELIDE